MTTPQKPGSKDEWADKGSKPTGGTGNPLHKEDMTPAVVTPKPIDHGTTEVPK